MEYDPQKHHRQSIRLKGYDYSQAGLYFITICCQHKACLFGQINNGLMQLNDAGTMIKNEWLKLPERFTNITLHEYIVMPNHIHAILEIVGATLVVALNDGDGKNMVSLNDGVTKNGNDECNAQGQPQGIAPTVKTVGDMVGAFESITTVEYIHGVKTINWEPFDKKLWQRNYWEHIIRNDESFFKISDYIVNNPANWNNDPLK